MSETAFATQSQIHAALAALSDITDEIPAEKILDRVPRGTQAPVMTVQITNTKPKYSSGNPLEQHELTIDLWRAGKSRSAVDQTLSRLKTFLGNFNGDDGLVRIVHCVFLEASVRIDPQQELIQGRHTYRVVSELL